MTGRRIGWSGGLAVLALAALGVGAWLVASPALGNWFAYAPLVAGPLPPDLYVVTGRRILGLVLVGLGLLAFGGTVGYWVGRRRTG